MQPSGQEVSRERDGRQQSAQSTVLLPFPIQIKYDLKNKKQVGRWWLTPVILATWEAEIRRISGQSQPGKKFPKILSQQWLGAAVYAFHPKLCGRLREGGLQFQVHLGKKGDPISRIIRAIWAPVAYNPSYSGGRDQEDRSLKPAWANSSQNCIKKTLHKKKKGLVEWLKV
jgi:hypothetical protein